MASRTLDQVINSLNTTYNPQIQSLQRRQSTIPGQIAQEEQGLQAKQTQAFGDILNGARRRGLGFSGIPLGEQATYTSTEFLPALARLKQTGREQAMSLEDAILGLRAQQRTQGQGIYEGERAYALQQAQMREQQRQFNENLRLQREQAARAASSAGGGVVAPTLGYASGRGGGAARSQTAIPKPQQRADGGFNFQDANGRPVSAMTYAKLTGQNFANIVNMMAQAGDRGAKAVLTGAGPSATRNPSVYRALTWR